MSRVLVGDCRAVMAEMDAASVDAVVTDPPYELGFMGKGWDKAGVAFDPATWEAVLRVLKPGGHLLAFGGDRTIHRMICAIEDAGFEIRNQIAWIHAQGFPKNLNVSSALGQMIPVDARCVCARHSSQTVLDSPADYPDRRRSDGGRLRSLGDGDQGVAPSQDGAREHSHDGQRGDDLASSQASISLDGGSVRLSSGCSQNQNRRQSEEFQANGSTRFGKRGNTSPDDSTATHKTAPRKSGMLRSVAGSAVSSWLSPDSGHPHIAHCSTCSGYRVSEGLGTALKPAMELVVVARKPLIGTVAQNVAAHGTGALNIDACRIATDERWAYPNGPGGCKSGEFHYQNRATTPAASHDLGRWPANVCLDETAAALLDEMSGERKSGGRAGGERRRDTSKGGYDGWSRAANGYGHATFGDAGGASRFFYCAKASRSERNAGLDGMPERDAAQRYGLTAGGASPQQTPHLHRPAANHHPTVKPVALMRWLVKLVTPPDGLVLDPFCGSGSTGVACAQEGFRFLGIEQSDEYAEIARRRIAAVNPLFAMAAD